MQFSEPGAAISERPISKMENMNSLSFEGVEFHELVQIQHVLCLIGSSPNLQYLLIEQVRTSIIFDALKERHYWTCSWKLF